MPHRDDSDTVDFTPKFSRSEVFRWAIVLLWIALQFYLQTHYTPRTEFLEYAKSADSKLTEIHTSLVELGKVSLLFSIHEKRQEVLESEVSLMRRQVMELQAQLSSLKERNNQ